MQEKRKLLYYYLHVLKKQHDLIGHSANDYVF